MTVNYLSGMRASGGVDAVASTGTAYYLVGREVLLSG
jgi:hypothetical protein